MLITWVQFSWERGNQSNSRVFYNGFERCSLSNLSFHLKIVRGWWISGVCDWISQTSITPYPMGIFFKLIFSHSSHNKITCCFNYGSLHKTKLTKRQLKKKTNKKTKKQTNKQTNKQKKHKKKHKIFTYY